jgi:hypothetical protein
MANILTFVVPLGVVGHIIIKKEKGTNTIVLLALVDANYKFIAVDVGAYSRNRDGNIFANSTLYKLLERGTLNIPTDTPLRENGEPLPHVMVGDEAFPLKPYLLYLLG